MVVKTLKGCSKFIVPLFLIFYFSILDSTPDLKGENLESNSMVMENLSGTSLNTWAKVVNGKRTMMVVNGTGNYLFCRESPKSPLKTSQLLVSQRERDPMVISIMFNGFPYENHNLNNVEAYGVTKVVLDGYLKYPNDLDQGRNYIKNRNFIKSNYRDVALNIFDRSRANPLTPEENEGLNLQFRYDLDTTGTLKDSSIRDDIVVTKMSVESLSIKKKGVGEILPNSIKIESNETNVLISKEIPLGEIKFNNKLNLSLNDSFYVIKRKDDLAASGRGTIRGTYEGKNGISVYKALTYDPLIQDYVGTGTFKIKENFSIPYNYEKEVENIELRKIDSQGAPLSGATFRVWLEDPHMRVYGKLLPLNIQYKNREIPWEVSKTLDTKSLDYYILDSKLLHENSSNYVQSLNDLIVSNNLVGNYLSETDVIYFNSIKAKYGNISAYEKKVDLGEESTKGISLREENTINRAFDILKSKGLLLEVGGLSYKEKMKILNTKGNLELLQEDENFLNLLQGTMFNIENSYLAYIEELNNQVKILNKAIKERNTLEFYRDSLEFKEELPEQVFRLQNISGLMEVKNGSLTLRNLPLNTNIYIEEVKAPLGYVEPAINEFGLPNEKNVLFETRSTYEDLMVKTIANVQVKNLGKPTITKIDRDTRENIPNVKFKVWSKKPDNEDDKNNLIGEFITGENGIAILEDYNVEVDENNLLLSDQILYIYEVDCPDLYQGDNFKNRQIEEFTIGSQGELINGLNYTYENEKKDLKVLKMGIDIKNKEKTPLKGIQLEIYKIDENNRQILEENILLTSDKQGEINIPKNLKLGKYLLREKNGKSQYLSKGGHIYFEITPMGLIFENEDIIFNQKGTNEVFVEKNSLNEIREGATYKYLISQVGNYGFFPLGNFTIEEIIPYENFTLESLKIPSMKDHGGFYLSDQRGRVYYEEVNDEDDQLEDRRKYFEAYKDFKNKTRNIKGTLRGNREYNLGDLQVYDWKQNEDTTGKSKNDEVTLIKCLTINNLDNEDIKWEKIYFNKNLLEYMEFFEVIREGEIIRINKEDLRKIVKEKENGSEKVYFDLSAIGNVKESYSPNPAKLKLNFTRDMQLEEIGVLYLQTEKRADLEGPKYNLVFKLLNKITGEISEYTLGDLSSEAQFGVNIKDIVNDENKVVQGYKLVFQQAIHSGFRFTEGENMEVIGTAFANKGIVDFPNRVKVSGTNDFGSVQNENEWDVTLKSKEKSKIPKTGSKVLLIFGMALLIGYIFLFVAEKNRKDK